MVLAQSETDVRPVLVAQTSGRLLFCHRFEFVRGEPVCLQIGQTPVGVPELGTRGIRSPIGIDRLVDAPDRLQRMAVGQVHCRTPRRQARDLLVQPQPGIEVANCDTLVRVGDLDGQVAGFQPEQ